MPDIEVKEIIIKLKKKELKLSLSEAKQLQHVLDDLLSTKPAPYIPPVIIERPSPYPLYPTWTCSGTAVTIDMENGNGPSY